MHPEIPTEGVDIASYLEISSSQFDRMETHLRSRAADLGIPWCEERRVVNSHKALILTEWARAHSADRATALHRALFRAYFAEGRNLADEDVLRKVCNEVGLPTDAALLGLQDETYEKRLADTMKLAQAYEITGVPTFIVNNRYKIGGAQPYDVLIEAFRKIAQE